MALTRSLLRAESRRGITPRETLERANRHLMDVNESAMFVTVLYGVLSRKSRELAYVRAGHELPLLLSAAGEVARLGQGTGLPLGVIDNPVLDEHSVTLHPGNTLLLYTDGVVDAIDAGGRVFGLDRLRSVLAAGAGSGQALCDRLLAAVLTRGGTAPRVDDVTLVSVHAQSERG